MTIHRCEPRPPGRRAPVLAGDRRAAALLDCSPSPASSGSASPPLVLAWPDAQELERTRHAVAIALVLGAGVLFAAAIGRLLRARRRPSPLSPPGWSAAGARHRRLGDRHGQARPAAAALLPVAAEPSRSLHRRLAAARRSASAYSVLLLADGLRPRRRRRLRDRRVDRLVAHRRLLGASAAALPRPAAGLGLAAARLLLLAVQRYAPACS